MIVSAQDEEKLKVRTVVGIVSLFDLLQLVVLVSKEGFKR